MRADALGRADDGAEVVRVGDLVAQHEKRRLAALGCDGEHILDRAVFLDGAQRNHTLMRVCLAHGVEFAAVGLRDDDTGAARLRGDVPERLVYVALGDENFIDRAARAQGLHDRVAALDQIIARFCFKFLYLFHNIPIPCDIIIQISSYHTITH